jgi:hypothetical protein
MAVLKQKPVLFEIDEDALKCDSADSARFVFSKYFKPLVLGGVPGTPDPQDPDLLRQLFQSELGFLFLDRTRIMPRGFALGEHIQALSLAPGEELIVEQKTFSKRETTFEQQNEREQQFDIELSSTLSTELTEGLEQETKRSDQTMFNVGLSAGRTDTSDVGANAQIPGVPVSAQASQGVTTEVRGEVGYSRNITEASGQTRTRSVKDSSTATSKVASKYRALHKTTFRVSTESRFEASSRRVLRNPNQYSPLDLHYFKIMRRLELVQERYGVRLCWAVSIQDPAADVITRLDNGKALIVERALTRARQDLPPRPAEPQVSDKPPRIESSDIVEADKWGATGDMSADYDLKVEIPAGYVWDGNLDEVATLTRVWGRPPENMGWSIVGTPWVDGENLIVRIHVGAGSWLFGPKVFMQAKARFIAAGGMDPAYQRWLEDVARWEADVAERLAGPKQQAEEAADAWAQSVLAQLDPVVELMDRVAKVRLGGGLSDESWEVDFWAEVFDWRNAGVAISPGWWAARPARDLLQSPNSFLNASWAKLYLPVKPAFERLALRWIVGKVRDGELDPETEEAFATLIAELEAFREQSFGDTLETKMGGLSGDELQEQVITLGRWKELLPTDGTHLEVVQGATTAVDELSNVQLAEARKALAARTAGEEQDVELKKKAVEQIGTKTPFNVGVNIATEDGHTVNNP